MKILKLLFIFLIFFIIVIILCRRTSRGRETIPLISIFIIVVLCSSILAFSFGCVLNRESEICRKFWSQNFSKSISGSIPFLFQDDFGNQVLVTADERLLLTRIKDRYKKDVDEFIKTYPTGPRSAIDFRKWRNYKSCIETAIYANKKLGDYNDQENLSKYYKNKIYVHVKLRSSSKPYLGDSGWQQGFHNWAVFYIDHEDWYLVADPWWRGSKLRIYPVHKQPFDFHLLVCEFM